MFAFILVAQMGVAQHSMHWGLPADGLLLGISFEKELFEVDEPIKVKMRLTNSSAERIKIYANHETAPGRTAPGTFKVVGSGKRIVPRRWNPGFFGPLGGTSGQSQLFGFQYSDWDETITLSFHLREPGQYMIYATFPYRSPTSGEVSEAVSGNALIQIVPRVAGSTNLLVDPEIEPTSGKPWAAQNPPHTPTPMKARSYPGLKSGETAGNVHASPDHQVDDGARVNSGDAKQAVGQFGSMLSSRDGRFGILLFVLICGTGLWLWSRHRTHRDRRGSPRA